ncbi:MAG: glycosyl hydrolase 115 family protein [Treponema sp.]|nr:glycosyl hydrolase 115 family protein [Treponema sp.]
MNKFAFTVENEAFAGVKRIAQKAALDFQKVTGTLPVISETLNNGASQNTIVFATLGKSPYIDLLISKGKFDPSAVRNKREVYQIIFIDNVLVICGSDKRGTIYGIFALSEYIGVSPLCFWGDAEPVRRENLEITKEIEIISKEPSVKYRGFFINDEWPCFGEWTFKKFGGFTAQMYEHVFELLLRLKGNYLWPAMWSSSFALDGPGNLNEELADIYGVIIGASHHEPCLRASEEWDKVRGPDSVYGNEWNYFKNKNGLLKYWEDGLKRSGRYEKLITIGMRGERDTSMLGRDSSLKDNIDLLKDIITNQRQLIKKHVHDDVDSVPQLLALYKEVEEYFYGNSKTAGLKDWKELENVICMLCEDNFGFMRTLPTEELRKRKGGFGLYYHFDYHGGPISYEWLPSTSYERTWEQVCMAYNYGIRDVWIVNVGDLKFNEVPLAFFLELAYDFEKWGTGNCGSVIDEYTETFLKKTFPSADLEMRKKAAYVLHGYIRMNAMRRPEALNAHIYHPCHYLESDRMLAIADSIETLNEEIYSAFSENEKDAYYSMIYFPAKASVNLLRMNIYSAKNMHYANQGKKIANSYAALTAVCIEKDRTLAEEYASFKNRKWEGMETAAHIGFVRWNEDNCRYPLRVLVEPAKKPRLIVSRKDREEIYSKTYGPPMAVKVDDFLYEGSDEVILEIANDGAGSLDFVIEPQGEYNWLEISALKGSVEAQEYIILRCNKNKLDSEQSARLLIKDGITTVAVDIRAKKTDVSNFKPMTFLPRDSLIVMNADHFCEKKDTKAGSFAELKNYGRSGCGMKVFPATAHFNEKDEKPGLSYRFNIEEPGNYFAEIWTTPSNPVKKDSSIRFVLDCGKKQIITAVPSDFNAGSPYDERWCSGVLDNIRVSKTTLTLNKGVQQLSICALEPGLVLEKILLYRHDREPLKSYLGPPESAFTVSS